MKKRSRNKPPFLTVHTAHYWICILLLMLWGIYPFLYFMIALSYAVPVIGAFKRSSNAWKVASVSSVALAVGFLICQYIRHGERGMLFFNATDAYGITLPQINFFTPLVLSSIFLPLSMACAIDRISKRRRESPLQAEAGSER